MNRLVGLVGYPGAGKDTLADALVEDHGWKKVAFADALKDAYLATNPGVKSAYGYYEAVTAKNLEYMKRKYTAVRESLQDFGQAMRDLDYDVWVKALFKQINAKPMYFNQDIIITDVRYMNERDAICNGRYRRAGQIGTMIGITREGCGPVNDHKSEKVTGALLEKVPNIHNDFSVEYLVKEFFKCFR